MFRKTLAAALCVAALAVSATADRITTHLDAVQAAVTERQTALPIKLNKQQKKAAKAYKSALKKLGKESTSLKTELKIAKGILACPC